MLPFKANSLTIEPMWEPQTFVSAAMTPSLAIIVVMGISPHLPAQLQKFFLPFG
jgi:hypothetical protein